MIKAAELRIGNYVEYDGKHYAVRSINMDSNYPKMGYVGSFSFDNIVAGRNLGTTGEWIAQCNPIPLTVEILEGCGFIEKRKNVWQKNRLQWAGSLVYLKNEDTEECYYIPTIVDYLHQLQNLYFSITGEELNVNM